MAQELKHGIRELGKLLEEERKSCFLENNIMEYIETISRHMKAFVTSLAKTITKKNTLKRTRLKFIGVIGTKIRPTRTTKNF